MKQFYYSALFLFLIKSSMQQTTPEQDAFRKSKIKCAVSNQCNKYSDCAQGVCMCDIEYVAISKGNSYSCVEAAKDITDQCDIDEQCMYNLKEDSFCDKSRKECECGNGTTYDNLVNKCLLLVGIGQPCKESRQCRLTGSSYGVCANGTCVCPPGTFHTTSNQCLMNNKLGENCNSDENCVNHGGICKTTCICGPTAVPSMSNDKCLPAATKYGDTCQEVGQCTKKLYGSECSKGICICSPGKHINGFGCYETKLLGESCKESKECYNNGYGRQDVDCLGGVCTCIGGKCKSVSCKPPHCYCQNSTEYTNSTHGRCVPQSKLGDPCQQDENCIFINGFCSTVCKCRVGYVKSTDNSTCLKAADKFGENCVQDNQCSHYLSGAQCIAGVCSCKSGEHPFGTECFKDVSLHDSCSKPQECYINNLTNTDVNCINSKCTCIGGQCRFTSCISPHCKCEKNEYLSKDRCVSISQIGQKCDKDENCSYFGANCVAGICECPKDFVVSDQVDTVKNGKICISAAQNFGDSCIQESQCTLNLKNSNCLQAKCGCSQGNHAHEKQCYKDVVLHGQCSQTPECFINGYTKADVACHSNSCTCIGGQCRFISCPKQYCKCQGTEEQINEICYESVKLGQSCTANENCKRSDGICIRGICSCASGKIESDVADPKLGEKICLDVAQNFDDPCVQDSQCTLNLKSSICYQSKCSCPNSHHKLIKRCYKTVDLNGQCFEQEECLSKYKTTEVNCIKNQCKCLGGACRHISCETGYCTCDQNETIEHEKCVMVSSFGGHCTTDAHCAKFFATCQNSICRCPADKVASENYQMIGNIQGRVCLGVAQNFGDPCNQDSQCSTNLINSVCIKGQCACNTGHHPYGSKCYRNVKLDLSCGYPEECFIDGLDHGDVDCLNNICRCLGSKCSKKSCHPNYCTCDSGEYRHRTNKCVPKIPIGRSCAKNIDCEYFKAECINGICTCPAGKLESTSTDPKYGGTICLDIAENFGDNCVQQNQCTPNLQKSICSNGKCGCEVSYYPFAKICFPAKGLGGNCDHTPECLSGNFTFNEVSCINNKCLCLEGWCRHISCQPQVCRCGSGEIRTTTNICLSDKDFRAVGESCTRNEECELSKAICLHGRCQCPEGKQLQNVDHSGYKGQACLNPPPPPSSSPTLAATSNATTFSFIVFLAISLYYSYI